MTLSVRLHAKGPRGEACIVVKTCPDAAARPAEDAAQAAADAASPSYRLATGERLHPTADPIVFETLDRRRAFTLRQ